MNVLSLFDGKAGGLESLKRLIKLKNKDIVINNYFSSEIDKNAIKVAIHNHPEIQQLGDITKIDEDVLKKLPKIDVLFVGSPCTQLSRQGNGEGLEGKDSKLFFDFVRILNWLRENNNPNIIFLLENVVMKKEWKDIMTSHVGVDCIEINSGLLSAQKRPRLYWTNIEGVTQPNDRNIYIKDILEDEKNIDESLYLTEEELRQKPVEIQGKVIDNFITIQGDKAIVRNATKQGYLIAEDGDSINISVPNSKTRRGRVGKGKANTLDTQCRQAVFINGRVRWFTITELERLQTFSNGYTNVEGISLSARKKMIGNGWNIDTIVHILSFMNLDKFLITYKN